MSFSSKLRNVLVCIKDCLVKHKLGFKHQLKKINMTSVTTESDDFDDAFSPPTCVRGMKVLDRELFQKKVAVPAISVPKNIVNQIKKNMKKFMLCIPKLKPISDDNGCKMFLLDPKLIANNPQFNELVTKLELELKPVDINLTYENWGYSSIMKAILPPNLQLNVTSFSTIGHIIHMNLKEDVMEYKSLMGQVILDKVASAKTVINKTKTIDGVFRNLDMEVLAGEPNFQVCVKENGLAYEFDFSKVFWNPRLGFEHSEVIKKINKGDVVFDVFAGVGPFAIPAAKKKCTVYANDLNPDSYKWLCHNAHLNKASKYLTAYNLDGKNFICSVVKDKLTDLYRKNSNLQAHILMNLPASAVEFLDCFKYLLDGFDDPPKITLPIVYCYFFASKQLTEQKVIDQYLNADMQKNIKEVSVVRNIAPNKRMVRLEFKISEELLFQNNSNACGKHKRLKLDDEKIKANI